MNTLDNTKVLIGITSFNRSAVLGKAITSALEQQYEPKEVMVIDDASTDQTPAVRQQFDQIRWIQRENSVGYRANRNEMMGLADFRFYVSLDDDAWFLVGDEIHIAMDRMASNEKLAAIAFDILSPDKPDVNDRSNPVPANMFIGCGHLLRLSAVREVGYYVDSPGSYGGEEKDLCIRLIDAGYEIEKLPGVHVWHDKAWDDRDWFGTHQSGVCNDLALCLMRCPFPVVVGAIPFKIFRHLWFAIKNPQFLGAALSGVFKFVRNFFKAIAARKPVRYSSFRMLRNG